MRTSAIYNFLLLLGILGASSSVSVAMHGSLDDTKIEGSTYALRPISEGIKFTYLDIVDDSIIFSPVFYTNFFVSDEVLEKKDSCYHLVPPPKADHIGLPGYDGKRCIITLDMALQLREIQSKLRTNGYSLKVFDAYRPQKAVDYLTEWRNSPDDPLVKRLHYPNVEKKRLKELNYLIDKSSHTRGAAVDLTIVRMGKESHPSRPAEGFLGLWDGKELDMGKVGYLAFDERSNHGIPGLTEEQNQNRVLLRALMLDHGFKDLKSEFWHYFYKPERNPSVFYNFNIKDDYPVAEDKSIILPPDSPSPSETSS